MTHYIPMCPLYTGSATQADEVPVSYDSQGRGILSWARTGREQFFSADSGITISADSGITISGVSTDRGYDITLQSGRSYYIWARPMYGASTANTSIEAGIYLYGTNTLVGTKGRGQTGQSLRLMTEIYGMSAAAVILPSDFSGSTMVLQVRLETITGTWNQSGLPVNDDTKAQGRASLVIYSTPA